MRPDALLLAALGALPSALTAQGLEGRTVLMRGETWDDPAAPYLVSSDYVGEVGEGPEFGFIPETNGTMIVVPVTIDLGPDRVSFSYEGTKGGTFTQARFNGYVLTFPVECTLLEGARLDLAGTTPALAKAEVKVGPRGLRVDVAGLTYTPRDRIELLLDVTDCPIS